MARYTAPLSPYYTVNVISGGVKTTEAQLEAVLTLTDEQKGKLARARHCYLVGTGSVASGTPSFMIDSLSVSYDGTNYVTHTASISQVVSGDGAFHKAITVPFLAPSKLRLDCSSVALSGQSDTTLTWAADLRIIEDW